MLKKLIAVVILFPALVCAESVTIEGYNPDPGSSQTPPQQNTMPPSMQNNQSPQGPQPSYQMPQQNAQPGQNIQPAPAQAAVSAAPTQQAVSVQTVVPVAPQSAAQPISPEEMTKWQEFFNNLAACTVGVFDLRQLDASLAAVYGNVVTNTINSKQGDLCSVTVSLSKPTGAEIPAASIKRMGGYECLLSKATVTQMISYYSDILKSGSSKSVIDPALNASMSKECKLFVWVNGQKSFAVEK